MVTGWLVAFLAGPAVIRHLRARKIGQIIRADGPATHQEKRGTPTMGGVIIILATIAPTLLWSQLDNRFVLVAMLATVWMGAIGFLDDYLKGKKSVKLTTKQEVFLFFKKQWPVLHEKYSLVKDQCDDAASPFGELDSSFLIATKKRIFFVSSNMCVTEFLKFYAIGAGRDYAIGAMHVLYDQEKSAEEIARLAIEAAISNNVYCGGNIEIMKP